MANKPKFSTNNVISLSTAVVVVTLLLLLIIGRGFITRIAHNGRVISKKQAADKQLTSNLNALQQLSQNYQNSGGNLKKQIDDALPTTPEFPSIIATMESIAGTSGVALSSVSSQGTSGTVVTSSAGPVASLGAAVPTGQAIATTQYPLTLSIGGNYDSIMKFLTNLQLSARPMRINSIQLSGNTDGLSASVNLTTYYFDPQVLQDKTEAVK